MITAEQLHGVYRTTPISTLSTYIGPLNDTMSKYDMVTKLRQAMFIAQIGDESARLTAVRENLNYSSTALTSMFGKYFDVSSAIKYQRNPQAIANRIYANRMGNGNEASGDGWTYRGRGAIQITGKYMYQQLCDALNLGSLSNTIAYLETPVGVIGSAGWFWDMHHLNKFADAGDVVGCTKLINGGTVGLADRQALYTLALHTL